jgi:transcriptional regulator with XRE-family HTH domain
MAILQIAEHLVQLRHEKGITQDELALFLGVTKASVSKWETGQSYPDILLLPKIATYYNTTIDALLGYEPQLCKEQIRKIYGDLTEDFIKLPFEQVMDKSRELVHEYYSCYPFVQEIAILWLNHFMLAKDPKMQMDILEEIKELCNHIQKDCSDVGICGDIMVLKATVDLYMGKYDKVIESMEPIVDPTRLRNQADTLLIQAYQMAGNNDKADYYNQMSAYAHLLSFMGDSIQMISIHMDDPVIAEMTIKRTEEVIKIYELLNLHPNVTLQFYYQKAIYLLHHEDKEGAIKALSDFTIGSIDLVKNQVELKGDRYFNRIDEWIEETVLGKSAPRSLKFIFDCVLTVLTSPEIEPISKDKRVQDLIKLVKERSKQYDTK